MDAANRKSDDFCISEMARGLGHHADFEKYTQRSRYWRNMFKADQTSFLNGTNTGFTGFLQPRYLRPSNVYETIAILT